MANPWKFSVCFLVISAMVIVAAGGREIYSEEEEGVARREAERVTNLPGQPAVKFNHYSGYVKLEPHQDQKALFYWFFEAQEDASQKPLVLWLNGGPACSSIAYGAAQEIGPFLVRGNEKLTLNKFSWNQAASMLFLEAPVGVGFSYTNNSEDLHRLGDKITADDSHAFLINWFKRFPSFRSHDFYIAGESYAGHYVPQLAELIYERNKRSTKESFIDLKGFMIGNAFINELTDWMGMVDFAWSHAIISDQLYHRIKECDSEESSTSQCDAHHKEFMEAYSDIDVYSIYTPICLFDSLARFSPNTVAARRLLIKSHDLGLKLPSRYDQCTGNYAEKFFNREDVQRALHANVTKLNYPYKSCSDVIEKWNESPETTLPIIQKLLNAGLRIWIYSGDTDGKVPVTSTRYSINKMGLRVKEEWRSWFHKNQVAGWVETYEGGLLLATVHGAGHRPWCWPPCPSLCTSAVSLSLLSFPLCSDLAGLFYEFLVTACCRERHHWSSYVLQKVVECDLSRFLFNLCFFR